MSPYINSENDGVSLSNRLIKKLFCLLLALGLFTVPTGNVLAPTYAAAFYEVAVSHEPLEIVEVVPNTIEYNCYLYIKSKIPSFPMTKDIVLSVLAMVGSVVVFDYDGLPHYALVEEFRGETMLVSECNFKAGTCGTREVSRTDPHIQGYWTQSNVP